LRKLVLKISVAGGLLAVCAALAAAFAFPTYGAILCPACYGFESVDPQLFVERGTPLEARVHAMDVLARASARVTAFYGGFEGHPRILVCATDGCYHRMGGGGSAGMAIRTYGLLLSARGTNPTILSHELSHIELKSRLRSASDSIPVWFNEGLAVYVSGDARYLAPAGSPDRCLVRSTDPLPENLHEWLRRAGPENLYAKAGCRVSDWISAKGGPAAVQQLLSQIAAGKPFTGALR